MTEGATSISGSLKEGWQQLREKQVIQRMSPLFHLVRFANRLYHQENGPEIFQNGTRVLIDSGILWFGEREGIDLNLDERALTFLAPHATPEEIKRTQELLRHIPRRREYTDSEWALATEVRVSGSQVAGNWRQIATLAGDEKADYYRANVEFANINRNTLVNILKAMKQFNVRPKTAEPVIG